MCTNKNCKHFLHSQNTILWKNHRSPFVHVWNNELKEWKILNYEKTVLLAVFSNAAIKLEFANNSANSQKNGIW